MLDELARARLVVVDTGTVEIVHESLIERWPMLRRWLDENQEDAAFLARLRTGAREWYKQGKAEGLLWAGEVARDAKHWHERYERELAGREAAFLEAVFARSERAARRRRRLLFGAMMVLVVVALSATAGVWVVLGEQRETRLALRQSKRVQMRLHVRDGIAARDDEKNPRKALHYFSKAAQVDPDGITEADWRLAARGPHRG